MPSNNSRIGQNNFNNGRNSNLGRANQLQRLLGGRDNGSLRPRPAPRPGFPGLPTVPPPPTAPETAAQLKPSIDTSGNGLVSNEEIIDALLNQRTNRLDLLTELNDNTPVLKSVLDAINTTADRSISDTEVALAINQLNSRGATPLKTLLANSPTIPNTLVNYILNKNTSLSQIDPDMNHQMTNRQVLDALLLGRTNNIALLSALNSNTTDLRSMLNAVNTEGGTSISNAEAGAALAALRDPGSALSQLGQGTIATSNHPIVYRPLEGGIPIYVETPVVYGPVEATQSDSTEAATRLISDLPSNLPTNLTIAQRELALDLVNYLIYKNTTVDNIDSSNNQRIDDQETLNALLSNTVQAGNFLNQINANGANLVSLLQAIDGTNGNRVISNDEVRNAVFALRDSTSALSVLKNNPAIGETLVNFILDKNTSITAAQREAFNTLAASVSADNVISDDEVYNQLKSIVNAGTPLTNPTAIPADLAFILGKNSHFQAIKTFLTTNNLNTLNNESPAGLDANARDLHNAKAVFRVLLSARAAGIENLIKDKIKSSSKTGAEHGFTNVDDVQKIVRALDPDNNGTIANNNYIQRYLGLKASSPSLFTSNLSTLISVNDNPAYDFSNQRARLDRITTATGGVDYAKIGTEIAKIKLGTQDLDVDKVKQSTTGLLLQQVPSAANLTSLDTLLATIPATAMNDAAKATLRTNLIESVSLTSSQTLLEGLRTSLSGANLASLDTLKTNLKNDFALITAIDTITANASGVTSMPIEDYIKLNLALQGTTIPAEQLPAITAIKNSYTTTSPSKATIDDVTNRISQSFNVPITVSNIADLNTSFQNTINLGTSAAAKTEREDIAIKVLQQINPNGVGLLKAQQSLDRNRDGNINTIEMSEAFLFARHGGIGPTGVVDLSSILQTTEDGRQVIRVLGGIDINPVDGTINDRELVNAIVKHKRGEFTNASDAALALNILDNQARFAALNPILQTLNTGSSDLRSGFTETDMITAAALLNARHRLGLATANTTTSNNNRDTLFQALGVSAALKTQVEATVATLAAIPEPSAANLLAGKPPLAVDANGRITDDFLRFYLKEQLTGFPGASTSTTSATALSTGSKYARGLKDDVVGITSALKTHPDFQRTRDFITNFRDGTSFTLNSLVKIIIQDNQTGASKLTTAEHDFFLGSAAQPGLIPQSLYDGFRGFLPTNQQGTGSTTAIAATVKTNITAALKKAVLAIGVDKMGTLNNIDLFDFYFARGNTVVDFNSDGIVDSKDREFFNIVKNIMKAPGSNI